MKLHEFDNSLDFSDELHFVFLWGRFFIFIVFNSLLPVIGSHGKFFFV